MTVRVLSKSVYMRRGLTATDRLQVSEQGKHATGGGLCRIERYLCMRNVRAAKSKAVHLLTKTPFQFALPHLHPKITKSTHCFVHTSSSNRAERFSWCFCLYAGDLWSRRRPSEKRAAGCILDNRFGRARSGGLTAYCSTGRESAHAQVSPEPAWLFPRSSSFGASRLDFAMRVQFNPAQLRRSRNHRRGSCHEGLFTLTTIDSSLQSPQAIQNATGRRRTHARRIYIMLKRKRWRQPGDSSIFGLAPEPLFRESLPQK